MMFPRSVSNFDESSSEWWDLLTADSTAHVKGAWTQVLAATAFEGFFISVTVASNSVSGTDTSGLLDIGYDAAGGTSYTVLVPNILAGHVLTGTGHPGRRIGVPCYIPTGSTVAARWQATVVSDTVLCSVELLGGANADNPIPNHGLIVDYGTTTASSSGTTPGNAGPDTEGAWVEMTAATTHPHRGLSVAIQGAGLSLGNTVFLIDIGIGASSSEVVLIENIGAESRTQDHITMTSPLTTYLRPIPEASRLAVRAQTSQNNAQDELDVAVYGVM